MQTCPDHSIHPIYVTPHPNQSKPLPFSLQREIFVHPPFAFSFVFATLDLYTRDSWSKKKKRKKEREKNLGLNNRPLFIYICSLEKDVRDIVKRFISQPEVEKLLHGGAFPPRYVIGGGGGSDLSFLLVVRPVISRPLPLFYPGCKPTDRSPAAINLTKGMTDVPRIRNSRHVSRRVTRGENERNEENGENADRVSSSAIRSFFRSIFLFLARE